MRLRARPFTLLSLAVVSVAAGPWPTATWAQSRRPAGYEYVSPMPGARMVSPWNNVVIRPGGRVDLSSVASGDLSVVGSHSGVHEGRLRVSTDQRSLVFVPDQPFALGEQVVVQLSRGVVPVGGERTPPLTIDFFVSEADPGQQPRQGAEEILSELSPGTAAPSPGDEGVLTTQASTCDPLPTGYPPVNVLTSNHPEPARLFVAPYGFARPGPLLILDELGKPIFYRALPNGTTAIDFTRQHGLLTYFQTRAVGGSGTNPNEKYYGMDEATCTVVDSFYAGNGYITDLHDLVVLPNGHALLMSYDTQPVDMSALVSGGDPTANVTGLIVQEIDAAKNVVFQWRSWDDIPITDTVVGSLTAHNIDYMHGNAVAQDSDGNILVSCRSLSAVLKINRTTGQLMWRLGPHAKVNDFTFVNDARGFSLMHDIRKLPNGNISLFDNGNGLVPQYSRGVEYTLDETAMTATLVWEARNTPDSFGPNQGSVQHFPDGRALIGWGGTIAPPSLTLFHPDGTEALEIGFGPGRFTYRARLHAWRTGLFETDVQAIDFGQTGVGMSKARPLKIRNLTGEPLEITCFETTDAAFTVDATLPLVIAPQGEVSVSVRFDPASLGPQVGKLYARRVGNGEIIAQDVALSGEGVANAPPDCSQARASLETLWPPDGLLKPVTVEGVVDPDGDPIQITITGVRQDEPVDTGDDGYCPDAVLDGSAANLRAERQGKGDGRVIHVAFEANDGRGGVCTGTVAVCVPRDVRSPGNPCVDGGGLYDALGGCSSLARASALVAEPEAVVSFGITDAPIAGARATLSYALPTAAEITITVHDPQGRHVTELLHGRRPAGRHTLEWNASGMAPGVYFYRLRASGELVTRAFVVLR